MEKQVYFLLSDDDYDEDALIDDSIFIEEAKRLENVVTLQEFEEDFNNESRFSHPSTTYIRIR